MKKRDVFGLFILSVLIISLISVNVSFVSAADGPTTFISFFKEKMEIWSLGLGNSDLGVVGSNIKYMLLGLIVLLIYSILTYMNFPPSGVGSTGGSFIKFLIALFIGFLATFLITTQELITIAQSYTSLGVTISLFIPIMILVFFSLVTAKVGNPMGIFAQKIIWVIYSFYLFFKSLFYIILSAGPKATNGGSGVDAFLQFFYLNGDGVQKVAEFFVGNDAAELVKNQQFNPIILTIMIIISIAVFIIFVISNKPVVAWMDKEARDSEIAAQKAMLERSHSYDKLRSEEVKKT